MSQMLELDEYDIYKEDNAEIVLMNKLNEVIEKLNEIEIKLNKKEERIIA